MVDTSEGNAVDFVRASDKKKTGLELFEEDDSLSAESTGEEDEDGAGSDGWSQ